MYELTFEPNEIGQRRYELCHQSVVLSGKAPEADTWDDVVSLIRKLKSIGNPTAEKINKTFLYDLQEDGGTFFLENSEMKLLLNFISQPMWKPEALEDVVDCKTWLEKLPKVSGSLKKDAKPEEKRKAEALIGRIGAEPEAESAKS